MNLAAPLSTADGGVRALWLPFRAALRRWKYALLIRRSGLFDVEHYLRQCSDDPAARRHPIFHYLSRGAAAGLDPNPFFDTSFYVEQYADVAASGKNPLVHFIRHGAREGRVANARLDLLACLARPPGAPLRDGGAPLPRGAAKIEHPLARGRVPRSMRGELPRFKLDFATARPADRVLVVDQRVPTPDRDSASVRMFAMLKLLRRLGHEVTFVSDAPKRRLRYDRALRRLGVETVHGFRAALEHLAVRGPSYVAAVLSSPEIAERYLMPVRGYALGAKVVYDMVDLAWLRFERAAAVTGDPKARAEALRLRKVETLGAAAADLTLAVSADEREALLRDVPGARVEVLPNIHACAPTGVPWSARRDLMFVGSFAHAPNVDAVAWFVDAVLPLVERRLPGIVLRVVGGAAPKRIRRLHSRSVRVLGYVPSIAPVFEMSRVFVCPVRFGAGVKGKVGDAMSRGVPVVTTSIGAEGLLLAHGETALVADDPAAFAEAVVALYEDEARWTRMSRASLRHVAEHFGEARALERLATILPPLRQAAVPASPLRRFATRSEP